MEPVPTTLADRYQLIRVVGRGGMGEVWMGRDLRLHRDVAVKLLSAHLASEPGVRGRFDAEARAAAGLNHPNVVAVYDSGEHDGTPFLVMELLPGRTLADELAEGPLDPDRATTIAVQVLAALSASHAAGVLHRDIKPGNVLLAADGTAKVGDFGIAKTTEGLDLTSTGTIIGTAAYLAPERLAGHMATPQADLYAVGVLLYEALRGRKPFEGDTPLGLLRAVETHQPIPLAEARPGLDPALVATVDRAMAKDPAERFATAGEMAAALRGGGPAVPADVGAAGAVTVAHAVGPATRVLTAPGPPVGVEGGGGRAPALRPAWRRRGVPAAALILLAIVAVVVALATRGGSPPTTPVSTDGTSTSTSRPPVVATTTPVVTAPVPRATVAPTATTKKPPKDDRGRDRDDDD